MRNNIVYFLKLICFLSLALLLILFLNKIFSPKSLYDSNSPISLTAKGFYELEKGEVDIIIVGTSQAASSINPIEMYDAKKLHSYDLCYGAQPMYVSEAWIKEAIKHQSVDTVILDINYLFSDYSNDGTKHNNIDGMRWGEPKFSAVLKAIETDDNKYKSFVSYLWPLYRYHDRWGELDKNDYNASISFPDTYLKGFWTLNNNFSISDYTPLNGNEEAESIKRNSENEECLYRIIKMCKDNNINLILYKAPDHNFTIAHHNLIQSIADENSLTFYDMNMEKHYEKAGLNYQTDMDEANGSIAHTNLSGAKKISDYLADELSGRETLNKSKSDTYENGRWFNDMVYNDFYVHNQYYFSNYNELINRPYYTVLEVLKSDDGYIYISEGGNVKNEETGKDCNIISSIDEGNTLVEVKSDSKKPSIIIDGNDECVNEDGINIVVYNNIRHCVIDSIAFDVNNPENPGMR